MMWRIPYCNEKRVKVKLLILPKTLHSKYDDCFYTRWLEVVKVRQRYKWEMGRHWLG